MFQHCCLTHIFFCFSLSLSLGFMFYVLCASGERFLLKTFKRNSPVWPNFSVEIFTEEIHEEWKSSSDDEESNFLNMTQLVQNRIGPFSSKMTSDEHPNHISDEEACECQQTRLSFRIFSVQNDEFDQYEDCYVCMYDVIQPPRKNMLKLLG